MNADEFCHGFIALVLCLILISLGFLLGYNNWGKPIYENCVIVVDGIEYNCTSYPKILKNKTLEFQTDEKDVVIPFKKEINMKFE
jgi:hypothetical protein